MSGIIGGWCRQLAPYPGELLTSCLIRNAHAHGLSPYRFFNLIWPGANIWSRDFDREPALLDRESEEDSTRTWIEEIAVQLAVDPADVENATISPWRTILSDYQGQHGLSHLILSAGVHHRSQTRHALQYCPDCLRASDPFFRKEWRLGFVVICETHGRRLMDACPHCDAPVIPHRSPSVPPTSCHVCGLSLTVVTKGKGIMPDHTAKLQTTLLSALNSTERKEAATGTFNLIRALLAVSAPWKIRNRLADAFDLIKSDESAAFGPFENLRLTDRIERLTVVSAWIKDWPNSFRHGADQAGLTKNSFRRVASTLPLVREIDLLPEGRNVDRSWHPVIETPELRHLRKRDKARYRTLRAKKLVEFCTSGRSS